MMSAAQQAQQPYAPTGLVTDPTQLPTPPPTQLDLLFLQEWIVHYPGDSQNTAAAGPGPFPSGAGVNTFNFRDGSVIKYDGTQDLMNSNLDYLKKPAMRGLYFWADNDLQLEIRYRGTTTKYLNYEQFTVFHSVHIPFDQINTKCVFPANIMLVATTSLQDWEILRPGNSQLRRAGGTAPTLGAGLATQAWQALSSNNSNSSFTGANNYIKCNNVGKKTIIIFNKGPSFALNVNVQVTSDLTNTQWADDASTGAGTLVAAGNSFIAVVDVLCQYLRLRVNGNATPSAVTWEAHYMGFAGSK